MKKFKRPVKTGYVIYLAHGNERDVELMCTTLGIAQRELVRLNDKKISPNTKYAFKEVELVDS